MENYIKNNVNDITYPEWSFSMKNNFGIPKLFLKSYYIRGMSELIQPFQQRSVRAGKKGLG